MQALDAALKSGTWTSDEQAVAGVITFWAAARLGLLLPRHP
jgi:hypothetical protein